MSLNDFQFSLPQQLYAYILGCTNVRNVRYVRFIGMNSGF
jgi:hypothetical protein